MNLKPNDSRKCLIKQKRTLKIRSLLFLLELFIVIIFLFIPKLFDFTHYLLAIQLLHFLLDSTRMQTQSSILTIFFYLTFDLRM